MNDFWRSLKNAVDGALKTELEQHRDRGLCIGTVVLPRGLEIWCPESAEIGSWCEDHAPDEADEDEQVNPYLDDSELGGGYRRYPHDERYQYRGDRWSD